MYRYKEDLALNNQQRLICQKPNQTKLTWYLLIAGDNYVSFDYSSRQS